MTGSIQLRNISVKSLAQPWRHKTSDTINIPIVEHQPDRFDRTFLQHDRNIITVFPDPSLAAIESSQNKILENQTGIPKSQMPTDDAVLERWDSNADDAAFLHHGMDLPEKEIHIQLMLEDM